MEEEWKKVWLHLLFADDALLFCGVEEEQLRNLWVVLLCFEVVLGLKVNLGKMS